MNDEKKTFVYKLGRMVGCVAALCVALCLVGIAIAFTTKLYMWLF